MAARFIDGKALAQQVRERLAKESAAVLAKTGMKPGLATILVGDDPASQLYVKTNKRPAIWPASTWMIKIAGQHDAGGAVGADRRRMPTPRFTAFWFSCRCPNILTAKSSWKRSRRSKMRMDFIPIISAGWWKAIRFSKPVPPKESSR